MRPIYIVSPDPQESTVKFLKYQEQSFKGPEKIDVITSTSI